MGKWSNGITYAKAGLDGRGGRARASFRKLCLNLLLLYFVVVGFSRKVDEMWILILTCSGQYSSKRLKIQCVRYHQRPVLPGIANRGLTHLLKDYAVKNTNH